MVASVATIVAVSGCGEAPADNSATPAGSEKLSAEQPLGDPAAGAPPVDLSAVNLAYAGVIIEYEPVGVDQLAKDADLIVTGGVIGFAAGPDLYPNDKGGSQPTVIMSVKVLDVLQGTAPADGVVYVLQYRPAGGSEALDAAVPSGTRVGLYLRGADLGSAGVDSDAVAGTPNGAQVWAAGPQSFVVANGQDGGVVFPYIHEERPNMSLQETLPR
jgi:hypothetical protein